MKNHIGVIGLAVMGKNIALNMNDHGYRVAVFNRTTSVMTEVVQENPQLIGYETLEAFIESLEKPRKILLMVKAGAPVDSFIELLLPLLDHQDIIMDGGNSNYEDTIRRFNYLKDKEIRYLGVGISGGEEGARFGPALMPAGDKEAYEEVKDIFESIAAKAYGEPCVSYIGENGSGHFVKMVHNGIEYGDMELIAESYHILKELGGFSNSELSDIFKEYNKGELDSYLIEITERVLAEPDDLSDGYLIDVIKDSAGQKGTGKWTVISSLDEGINTSIITSAVYNRFLSSIKEERVRASKVLVGPKVEVVSDKQALIEKVRRALFVSKIMSYAQGFDLLSKSAVSHGWNLSFENIAKGWRGGCIIRARFLDDIARAYKSNPQLENLILDDFFKEIVFEYQSALREVINLSITNGIAVSAFASAITYYDGYRNGFNPANLIQGQRDYFGAHTYERLDRPGSYHYEWFK